MRWLLILALAGSCFGQELLRPTTDLDGLNNLSLGCTGQNVASPTMPLGHDSAGISTKSTMTIQGTQNITKFNTRVFSAWQPTGNVYSALTINVNWSGTETTTGSTGAMCVKYSIDGGANWSGLGCTGGSNQTQTTSTATLTPTQNLSTLKVAICAKGAAGGDTIGSKETLNIFDVWTVGTISGGQAGGTGSAAGNSHRGVVIVN